VSPCQPQKAATAAHAKTATAVQTKNRDDRAGKKTATAVQVKTAMALPVEPTVGRLL